MKEFIKKYKMIAVVSAVAIIPLVYSSLFLYAFWDPYSRMNELPIAVITEDLGAEVNGEFKNVGQEVVDELKSNTDVKWIFTDAASADSGLNGTDFYAMVTFPKDFTASIAKADSPERIKGLVEYKLNEKRNFLAGQVLNKVASELENKISKTITEEVVQAMTDEIKKVPEDLAVLADGLGEMKDGTSTLYSKTGDLIEGQSKFNKGVQTLDKGISEAAKGSAALSEGATQLATGTQTFATALKAGSTKSGELAAGSAQFSTGLGNLDTGIQKYTAGVNQLVDTVNQSAQGQVAMAAALKTYLGAHPEAMKDPNMQAVLKVLEAGKASQSQLASASELLKTSGTSLSEGSTKINTSYGTLNNGINTLSSSMNTAAEKAAQVSAGAATLKDGAAALSTGLEKASNGTGELNKNATLLIDGEKKLQEGIKTLDDGVGEARDEVNESVVTAKEQVGKLDGINTYAADPMDINAEKINSVPDYGTAFTPYFVSLSIWVGALMMFFAIYLDPTVRFRRSNSKSKGFARFGAYTAIGLVQAMVLAVVLRKGLHLDVKNVALFYITCIATSLAFVSIMRFFLVHLGEVGKFLAILMLILQLTACGGTFPIELVPMFFQKINPLMPMTYSVNALKEVISGIDYSLYQQNMLVLFGLALGFFILNVGIAKIKTDRNPDGDPIF